MWRSIYLPDDGGRWASLDYSQQEPRLFVHFAHIAKCPGTQLAVDKFHAGYDWHDMTTEMAFGIKKADDPVLFAKMRKRAKAVFLGLTYGMGQAKMCLSCGFSTEIVTIRGAERVVAGPEGRAFLEEFNNKVPFLKDIKDRAERVAWNRRYIRTILGRHIHYPPGLNMERKALNNLIQGSAADQMKLAMVLMDEQNHKIQLQIHDEIDITVYDEKSTKDMAEIMINCVPLIVPSKVDVEIGANWGDSMG
jgi:DNA polymerase I-like protein with 3'-5' exonuclease and polymerase domains